AHVLDRDHRLVGKRRCKFDLLIGERLYSIAPQIDGAERHAFPQQRDREDSAMAQLASDRAAFRVRLRLGLQIRDMDSPALQDGAPANRAAPSGYAVPNWCSQRAKVGD